MDQNADILVLNSGSSSLKFTLYRGAEEHLKGQVSGLGATPRIDVVEHQTGNHSAHDLNKEQGSTHASALQAVLETISASCGPLNVKAVGHRVVHGGPDYVKPVIVTKELFEKLRKLVPLAPLHQPHNLAGIEAAREAFPEAVQVACFDTAFHRGHPWVNDTFALPQSYYDEGVRRYGFHGLSYEYICQYLQKLYPEQHEGKLIVAHLGNGASMCAIRQGRSIGSTMGFTALDGLPMGTRCGQLDPGVVLYLLTTKGMSAQEVSDLLYKNSGLKGLSGISQDMRELTASDDLSAKKAIDYFVFRIRREIGAMAAVLGGLDTLVFTGGIGEHSELVRQKVCEKQEWIGVDLDADQNLSNSTVISSPASRVKVMVLKTNEEDMIRQHTVGLLKE